MRKTVICEAAAILICLSLFSCSEQHDNAGKTTFPVKQKSDTEKEKTIVLRCDLWPPFNSHPDSPLPGSFIEIIRNIYEKEGFVIDYELAPYNRSIQGVRNGDFDATIGTAKSEAPDFVFPEEEIGRICQAFFAKQGTNWRYTGIPSLERVNIGVIQGYSYEPSIDEYLQRNRYSLKVQVMVGDHPAEKNIKKLLKGRFDVMIESVDVMKWTMKSMKIDDNKIIEVGRIPAPLAVYIAFSPKKKRSQELARIYDRGVRDLRYSGKLKTILEKYSMRDWK